MLTRNPDKISTSENFVVQEYIDKPFLVDGYKTDMRIYVLVTSCDPLKFFLFNDGLLRMSTEKYTAPTDSNLVGYTLPPSINPAPSPTPVEIFLSFFPLYATRLPYL